MDRLGKRPIYAAASGIDAYYSMDVFYKNF
jgi:hypothetical protein